MAAAFELSVGSFYSRGTLLVYTAFGMRRSAAVQLFMR
jgi:hypothetical protein